MIDHLRIVEDFGLYPNQMSKSEIKKFQHNTSIFEEDRGKWKLMVYKIEDIKLLKDLGVYNEVLRFIRKIEKLNTKFLKEDYSTIEFL